MWLRRWAIRKAAVLHRCEAASKSELKQQQQQEREAQQQEREAQQRLRDAVDKEERER
jgi:hypothetical protein